MCSKCKKSPRVFQCNSSIGADPAKPKFFFLLLNCVSLMYHNRPRKVTHVVLENLIKSTYNYSLIPGGSFSF